MVQDQFPSLKSNDVMPATSTTAIDVLHEDLPPNTADPSPVVNNDSPPNTANTPPSTLQEGPPQITTKPEAKKAHHNAKLAWLRAVLKAPVRVLRAIGNSYVRSMTRCADSRFATAGGFGMGAAHPPLPRSYSTTSRSSQDDYSELVRATSQSVIATRVLPAAVGPDGIQRSRSAVVWRIDEDREADFGTDGGDFPVAKSAAYPRSRSYAVAGSRAGVHDSYYPRRVGVDAVA